MDKKIWLMVSIVALIVLIAILVLPGIQEIGSATNNPVFNIQKGRFDAEPVVLNTPDPKPKVPCTNGACPTMGECSVGTCNPQTNTCSYTARGNGTSCNNGSGHCAGGGCVPNNCETSANCYGDFYPNDCSGTLYCNNGSCEVSGVPEGTLCGPAGNESGWVCSGGNCVPSDKPPACTPKQGGPSGGCRDKNPRPDKDCWNNICDPNTKTCNFTPNDGGSCTGKKGCAGTCSAGSCVCNAIA